MTRDEVFVEREPQPQTTMSPHARAVPLSESLEDMVEHCRRNALPGVITTIRTSWLARSKSSLTRLPTRVNLTALMMRFHTTAGRPAESAAITHDSAASWLSYHDGFGIGGGWDRLERSAQRITKVNRSDIETHLATRDASRSSTSCCAASAFLRVTDPPAKGGWHIKGKGGQRASAATLVSLSAR